MLPLGERPLLVRVGVHYKFSKLVVDRVEAVDGTYDVLFIGTGEVPGGSGGSGGARLQLCCMCNVQQLYEFLRSRLRPGAEGHPSAQGARSESGGHTGAAAGLSGSARTPRPRFEKEKRVG